MAEASNGARGGIRTRITVVATVAVVLALALGAAVFWIALRGALYGQLETAAAQDASAFAEQAKDSGWETLPDVDDDRFWQVVDRDSGAVLAASDAAEGAAAIASHDREPPALITLPDGDGAYLVAMEEDDHVVVAGRATATADETLVSVGVLLAISVPVVAAIVALTVWIAVGRALRPVDRMRRQVDAITATDLHTRVDEPRADDEIGRLARTMNTMLARLDDAQARQRRFVSDASHELKSPLASLRQYAEVAASHPDRISQDELSDAVLDEGARLERLVQGMLVLTRADENSLATAREDVDLDDVLFAEARRVGASSALTVDTRGVQAVRTHADAGLVRQAVRNLVDNATRHARSRVALSSGRDAEGAWIAVDDDGTGVPPDERERVFERFVRLDEARARDAGGSGLGLAIVAEAARVHGGSVSVADSPFGGARFVMRLRP
ncbi:MAG: ATP-binding protein [Microbacterium sp.]